MGNTMNNLHPLFRAALNDLRDGNAALARAAAKGPLKQDGTRMSYLRTRDDDDPYYMSPEEEKQIEADAEVEKLHAEAARQASVIADLDEALTKIAAIAGDYGDGAPDDHYLAHILLQLEGIATSALDEARGTHRKALESYKGQQP
jgi:hypothetical protein